MRISQTEVLEPRCPGHTREAIPPHLFCKVTRYSGAGPGPAGDTSNHHESFSYFLALGNGAKFGTCMPAGGSAVSAEVSWETAGECDYWAKERHVSVDSQKCSNLSGSRILISSRTCCFQKTEGRPCNSTRHCQCSD